MLSGICCLLHIDSFTIPPFCFLLLKEQVNSAFARLTVVTTVSLTHKCDTCIASVASFDFTEYHSSLYFKGSVSLE